MSDLVQNFQSTFIPSTHLSSFLHFFSCQTLSSQFFHGVAAAAKFIRVASRRVGTPQQDHPEVPEHLRSIYRRFPTRTLVSRQLRNMAKTLVGTAGVSKRDSGGHRKDSTPLQQQSISQVMCFLICIHNLFIVAVKGENSCMQLKRCRVLFYVSYSSTVSYALPPFDKVC